MRAPGATPSVIRRASRLLYAGRLLGTVDPARTDPPGRQTRIALDHLEAHREAIMRHMEERKAAIARQENPPDDEWVERPRYELIGTARE